MKHSMKVTTILMAFFIITQMFGLFVINKDLQVVFDSELNETTIVHSETIVGERPDFEPKESFISILTSILIGTVVALLLIKFKLFVIWDIWFFMAIFMSISISLGVFFQDYIAFGIAFILTMLKNYRSTLLTHNVAELLIYPGITLLFIPLLDIFWMFMLLAVISVYDMYAVWHSKHMITLAEHQLSTKKFAGFMINKKDLDETKGKTVKKSKKTSKKAKKKNGNSAILGGGDVFFPLLFSGVVMEHLIKVQNIPKLNAYLLALIITVTTTLSLFALFYKSEKGKFYPAMPFVSAGCLLGYLIIMMLIWL